MKNKFFAIALIMLFFVAGCSDKAASIKLCWDRNQSYYDTTIGCDTICMDRETGEKHTYDGKCEVKVSYDNNAG